MLIWLLKQPQLLFAMVSMSATRQSLVVVACNLCHFFTVSILENSPIKLLKFRRFAKWLFLNFQNLSFSLKNNMISVLWHSSFWGPFYCCYESNLRFFVIFHVDHDVYVWLSEKLYCWSFPLPFLFEMRKFTIDVQTIDTFRIQLLFKSIWTKIDWPC